MVWEDARRVSGIQAKMLSHFCYGNVLTLPMGSTERKGNLE
jgi:hypothetical protein